MDASFPRVSEQPRTPTRETPVIFELVIDDSCVIRSGELKRILTVVSFENITVPAGSFTRCEKIRIDDKWPDNTETGYIWLAKGIGMIKWQRSTGRIDELANLPVFQ